MTDISRYIVDKILSDFLIEHSNMKKVVVIYPGRFQPYHAGHQYSYEYLVSKFGKNNVYIATSNITNSTNSPFSFKDKKDIMTKLFDIPSNKIVHVKNPYRPEEILKKFDSKNTAVITAVGEKDASRLGGNYYIPYKGNLNFGYLDKSYVEIVPQLQLKIKGKIISGIEVRNNFNRELFNVLYPKFDKSIFNMIKNRLSTIKSIDLIHEIYREDMPQIADGDIANIYNICKSNSIEFNKKNVNVNSLSPVQNDFIKNKTLNIINSIKNDEPFKPIIISNDNKIVDGNHRWLAYKILKLNTIPTYEINLSIDNALNLVKSISDTTEELHENVILEGGGYGHLAHPFEDMDLTFGDLKNMITTALQGKLELTQEKCIDGNSIIQLEKNGKITIKEVVDNKIEDKVLSYNIETGEYEFKNILDYANNGITSEWLEIELENGNRITVTPNHRIYVKNIGYIQAKDLTENMELITE